MKVVKIQGGVGNQMFQFAFGESLREFTGEPVFYDLSFYGNQTDFIEKGNDERTLDLLSFFPNVSKIINEFSIVLDRKNNLLNRLLSRVNKTIVDKRLFDLFLDPQNRFLNTSDLKKASKVYFEGYWQNTKYFVQFNERLSDYFNFEQMPTYLRNSEEYLSISNSLSVSIHIRRGDYLNSTMFHTLGLDYFERAINFFISRWEQVRFFVFTDDQVWVRNNLDKIISNTTTQISLVNTNSAYSDLCLMSFCKHHIISNSTFSWWASYLNNSSDKVIIAPARWVRNADLNVYITKSLLNHTILL